MKIEEKSWQAKAEEKVAATKSKIPLEWLLDHSDLEKASQRKQLSGEFTESFLHYEELEIIRKDSVPLVDAVRDGKYTAVQVARAYCKNAAIAHQIIIFDQALQRAQELDDYYTQRGTTVGPLHGLPISLKDQFYVKQTDTTMGYVGWIGTFEGRDDPQKVYLVESQIVKELVSLGAIIYCKARLNNVVMLY
ncbi:hypothetical protein MMC17_000570 [Xylographa soralifera]|nr:hypothetical protein [Xylographa soralifera]